MPASPSLSHSDVTTKPLSVPAGAALALLPGSETELAGLLAGAGVAVNTFGRGEAKTVAQLFRELSAGESRLHAGPGGKLSRRVDAVTVLVQAVCPQTGQTLTLVEDHQRFADGRVRRREGFGTSVKEKLTAGENPVLGAARALVEELGVTAVTVTPVRVTRERLLSPSYPGLLTVYVMHEFVCQLPTGAFKPDGYVETQADKQTVFRWQPAAP